MSSSLFPKSGVLRTVHQTPSLLQGDKPAFARQHWEGAGAKAAEPGRRGAHRLVRPFILLPESSGLNLITSIQFSS